MRSKITNKLVLLAFIVSGLTTLYADDLIFDSFQEAAQAAKQRAAEYDKRMKEHVAQVEGAWEKQNSDVGENATLDIGKITETRQTEQTSSNDRNQKLQDSVTDSINGLKQQMVNTASANTVGFAGAAAAYSWEVKKVNGKWVLSDTYDQAFFVSGKSGNTSQTTNTGNNPNNPENPEEYSGSNQINNSDSNRNTNNNDPENQTDPSESEEVTNDTPVEEDTVAVTPVSEESPAIKDVQITKPDRVVEITIQHPTTFEEKTVKVTEGSEAVKMTIPDGFSIPEDTRVKISAKSDIEIANTYLTMTIIDDEGESEPIDNVSMRNYRHLFRIPSDDAYSVNIYVNEEGKEPKKIMQLCLPVKAMDFGSRTISH